jgi:acyl carrier protein
MKQDHILTLREALSEVLERPVGDLSPDMQIDRAFDLDSVMFVQFLLAVEDRVPGLRFDPEALAEASFNNVGALMSFLDDVGTRVATA